MKQPQKTPAKLSSHIVLWTIVAAGVSAGLGQWWLSPVLLVAPLLWALHDRWPRFDGARTSRLTTRWAITVFVTTLVACAFVPDRAPQSVLFGPNVAADTVAWLSGEQAPVWGVWWLLVLPLAFAVGTAVSGGILGWMVLSVAAGNAAIHGAEVIARGHNLVQAALIALSPWQWALLVAMVMAATPLTELSLVRIVRRGEVKAETNGRRHLMVAAALVVLSLLLRLALSGTYTSLVGRWTVG